MGDLEEGQVLSTSVGSWTNSPRSYAYQWEDCNIDGLACSLISGATSSEYTIQPSDSGFSLRSIVTASNGTSTGSMYSGATGIATGPCTQTFSSSDIGTSPYPGASLNSAIAGAQAGAVFCLSKQVGTVDLYNNPAGPIYIEPAPGIPQAVAGGAFDVNGSAGGAANITIENVTGAMIFICAQGPSPCSLQNDNWLDNVDNGLSQVQDMPADSNIYVARNSLVDCTISCSGGDNGGFAGYATYPSPCPDGVTFAHNLVDAIMGDGLADNAECGTVFQSNLVENVTQNVNEGAGVCESEGPHCDGWQDNGGAHDVTLDGNFFYNDTDCWADLGSTPTVTLTITGNVCSTTPGDSSYWAQITATGMTFEHNTVASTAGGQVGNNYNGTPASNLNFINNIEVSALSLNPGQRAAGSSESYNLCPRGAADFSCELGQHNITGSPSFVGGPSPTRWQGFQLASGSPGVGAASDGQDMGVPASDFSLGSATAPSGYLPGPGG